MCCFCCSATLAVMHRFSLRLEVHLRSSDRADEAARATLAMCKLQTNIRAGEPGYDRPTVSVQVTCYLCLIPAPKRARHYFQFLTVEIELLTAHWHYLVVLRFLKRPGRPEARSLYVSVSHKSERTIPRLVHFPLSYAQLESLLKRINVPQTTDHRT